MTGALENNIHQLAASYAQEFIDIRHHLHAHPELSYLEFNTSAFIQQKLTEWDIPFTVLATTGVVGIIEGKNPQKRVVALRADMDALPIQEVNDVPYRSTNAGVMHACGHDVHSTCLLGAAKILKTLNTEWEGTVKLIFQPGEEKNPGGASIMIREGVLQNPAPQSIFALHVHPGLPVGKLSFRGGKVMASADEIYITIKAKGGHAAAPHLTADTLLTTAHLIVSLQQIVSRNNNPFNPTVLSFTSVQGGNTTNVIPSEVKIMGTFRAMDEVWRFKAHELIREQSMAIVKGMGAEMDLHIDVGYPFVHNDVELSKKAAEKAAAYLGADKIEETELRMGAEDFAYYTHHIPGCFFRLGAGNIEKGITSGVHTPTFNIDESAIETGMAMMALFGATNAE
ncbi:MAG: M20 metallopeptidase family protein [Ferruginibacter sp.]